MTTTMATSALSVFKQLEATPDLLHTIVATLSEEEAAWKPAPQRFSIAEIMAHLGEVETQVFRARLARMVNEDRPQLDAYDQEAIGVAGGYAGGNVHQSLTAFRQHRLDNLTYMKNLPAAMEARVGLHAELGPITVGQLLNEWAFHDLGHIRQIAELLRAYRYYPHLGGFQTYYTVNP
jgi:DinB family protein